MLTLRTTIHINRKISLVSNKAHRGACLAYRNLKPQVESAMACQMVTYLYTLPTTHLIRRYFTQPAPIISSTQKNDEIMKHIFLSRLKFHYDGRHIIIPSHIKFIPELCIICRFPTPKLDFNVFLHVRIVVKDIGKSHVFFNPKLICIGIFPFHVTCEQFANMLVIRVSSITQFGVWFRETRGNNYLSR